MTKLEELVNTRFTDEIKSEFVRIYKRAYEANADCYDPTIGHDNMVFGLLIHKSAKYFLADLAFTENWIRVVEFNPRFVFGVGEFVISSYRVGDTLDYDIMNCFPANTGGAPMLALANRRQLSFEFMKDGTVVPDDSNCRNLILGHTGNPNVGLCNLFLGVPAAVDHRSRITEWSSTFEIWRGGESGTGGVSPTPEPPPPKPPIERTAPPVLAIRTLNRIQKK